MARNQRDEPTATATQTYSTADWTISAPTAAGITITATEETGGGIWGCNTEAEMDAIETAIDALVVDNLDLRKAVTAIIDLLQSQGLLG